MKVIEKDRIEAGNLMEEVVEIFESCVQCGMCKSRCGVFRVLREEQYSARGKGDLLSEKILDKILFECNLCRACEESCPLNVKVCDAVLKGRQAMVLLGKGLVSNDEMIGNVRKTGNPFGNGKVDKDKLYCC
ncbi:MAG: (Fe-S)-binding protein [archaeon]